MIISASYKTDIPTFYGEWFLRRLDAGFCKFTNPYNRKVVTVPLDRSSVDGFVFWTKNLGPFMERLRRVERAGFPFVVQYTINGYPRELESSVVDAKASLSHARSLRDSYGPDVLVWRYDTIVHTSVTPPNFHIENFARLARDLESTTNEVVISFAHFYKKTHRNMVSAASAYGFSFDDPQPSGKREILESLARVATDHGMQATVCSQPEFLVSGATEARCIDARRLERIGGRAIRAKVKGNRPGCACFASRDIGEYDTCPHGCVYCYAVQRPELAKERFQRHDPKSPFLLSPTHLGVDDGEEPTTTVGQLPLF